MKHLMLLVLLTGCSSTQVTAPEEVPRALAKMPPSVVVADIDWKVEEGNLVLSSEDGVKLNTQFKDTVRYITDLKNVICYYEPKHDFCKEIEVE